MTTYCIISCIKGEPSIPREVNGSTEWADEHTAYRMLDRYCDLYGYDPDDFVVISSAAGTATP